jgi:hypothetical protein
MLNAVQTSNNVEDLVSMYNEEFDIQWDENDMIQAPEDDWIAAVLGDEQETIDGISC